MIVGTFEEFKVGLEEPTPPVINKEVKSVDCIAAGKTGMLLPLTAGLVFGEYRMQIFLEAATRPI